MPILIILNSSEIINANSNQEISDICENKKDRISCYRSYKSLPSLNNSTYLKKNKTIKIKIIPYKR